MKVTDQREFSALLIKRFLDYDMPFMEVSKLTGLSDCTVQRAIKSGQSTVKNVFAIMDVLDLVMVVK